MQPKTFGRNDEHNRHERWIAADCERIYAIMTDPQAFSRLIPPYTRVDFETPPPYRTGTLLTTHIDHLIKFTWHSRVLRVQRGRRIELAFLDGPFQGGTEIWELKPEKNGTRVTHTIIVAPRGVVRLIWEWKGRTRHNVLAEQFLDNLKAHLEKNEAVETPCASRTSPGGTPACLCGSDRFRYVLRRGPWHYLQCTGCGLVQLFPRPAPQQIITAYDGYLSSQHAEIEDWRRMMQPVIRRSADLIVRSKPDGGLVMDVGCGYGFFLAEMAQRGWQVQGVEIAPSGVRHARERLRLPVISQPLESLQWPENRFDVVTLFYVIEHLGDPEAMLMRLRRWLKPDGLLLLRWPHSTPIVRLLGPAAGRLDLYHTPFHMYDFSPRSMAALLTRCGFGPIRTVIGGYTLPPHPAARLSSTFFGLLALALEKLSGGRVLLPGVSKTTLAQRSG